MDVIAILDEASRCAHDPARAIGSALAAWREVPAPALAALIDELGARAPAPRDPMSRRRAWLRVVDQHHAFDVTALVAALDEPWAATEAHRLLAAPRDPRIDRGLRAILARIPTAHRAAVRAHVQAPPPVAIAPAIQAAIDRLVAARAAHVAAEGGLIDEVWAAPDDDGPRLVYGDWLQAHQDPRGEFIALQYRRHRGRSSQQERDREGALFRAYRDVWLGEVAGTAGTARAYERGFASEVTLHHVGPRVLAARDWATVHTVHVDGIYDLRLLDLLTGVRSLRAVRGLLAPLLVMLEERGARLPWTTLQLVGWIRPEQSDALRRLASLPAVDDLELRHELTEWLLTGELLPRLRRVTVPIADPATLTALFTRGAALTEATIRLGSYHLRFTSPGRRLAHLEARPSAPGLDAILPAIRAALPHPLDELVLG